MLQGLAARTSPSFSPLLHRARRLITARAIAARAGEQHGSWTHTSCILPIQVDGRRVSAAAADEVGMSPRSLERRPRRESRSERV